MCPGDAVLAGHTTRTAPTIAPILPARQVPTSGRTTSGGNADAGVTPTQTPPTVRAVENPSLPTALQKVDDYSPSQGVSQETTCEGFYFWQILLKVRKFPRLSFEALEE